MRSFAPTGHRHTAEVLQALRLRGFETEVHLSATAVDNVRGVLATAHVFVKTGVAEKDLWKAYRDAYTAGTVRPHRQGTRGPVSLPGTEDSRPAATTPTSASSSTRRAGASWRCARSTI